MAVKHVREYYDDVCNQYVAMMHEIRDFEEEANKGLFPPERLDEIKKMIEPLKANYETLSWIIFLLNQPNRKSKQKGYEIRNKKFIESFNKARTKAGVIKENEEVINKFKQYNKELKEDN